VVKKVDVAMSGTVICADVLPGANFSVPTVFVYSRPARAPPSEVAYFTVTLFALALVSDTVKTALLVAP
jgi:hypothetical protein